MKQKNLCQTHHLFYVGDKCPICEKERIERLAKKYERTEEKKPVDREINEEDLEKLINKFNVK